MRVIGIDPGTRHLGWGVIDQQGSRMIHVAHGVIDTVPTSPLADRLVVIDEALAEILARFRPEVGAVEGLFFAKDAQSAAKLGHARGIVLLRVRRAGLSLFEYAPAKVKRAVVGRGAAGKQQVSAIVCSLLRLVEPPREDAADALAIAVTHLHVARFDAALQAQTGTPAPRTPPAPWARKRGAR